MNGEDERDDRIARLLRAVRADADPALWTRVRARIEARERSTRSWLGWLMRPVALRGSLALLAAAVVTSAALLITAPRATTTSATSSAAESLEDALVAEVETPATSAAAAPAAARHVTADSGASR